MRPVADCEPGQARFACFIPAPPKIARRPALGETMKVLAATVEALALLNGCGDDAPIDIPDVVGERLDVAIEELQDVGLEGEAIGGGVFGIVEESNWHVCEQRPAAGQSAEAPDSVKLVVERECRGATSSGDDEEAELSGRSTESTVAASEQAAPPSQESYVYKGPKYEVVVVDEDVTNARLKQYWVLTKKFDYSTDAFKDQVKLVIEDIARKEKTAKLIVEVVSHRHVALAEAASTYEDFEAARGTDYVAKKIPQIERTHWVASYTGGFNPNTAQPSDKPSAFVLYWLAEEIEGIEKWKPGF